MTVEVAVIIAAHREESRLDRVSRCLQRAMKAADGVQLGSELLSNLNKLKDHKGTLFVDWDESVLSTPKRSVAESPLSDGSTVEWDFPIVCLLVEEAWAEEGEQLGQHNIGSTIIHEWGHK